MYQLEIVTTTKCYSKEKKEQRQTKTKKILLSFKYTKWQNRHKNGIECHRIRYFRMEYEFCGDEAAVCLC